MINIQEIKNLAREFFEKGGFQIEIDGELKPDQSLVVLTLESDDPRSLIGPSGENLFAIQHLLAQILRKRYGTPLFLDIDVNSYKKKRIEFLKELARSIADQVSLSKKPVTFEPMKAYERRIIHLELAGRSDITTASKGEEPERCIQVLPHII